MSTLVKKPSPMTGGPLELRSEPATVVYRGETIHFEKSYYHCVESEMEFVDEHLENENLKRIYDTYRRNHSIPLAEELKAWRESCGIPAAAMSIILGLGENQFGLYEDGVIPTPSLGKYLSLAMEPGKIINLLVSSRSSFTEKQYRNYFNAIMASLPPAEYQLESLPLTDYGAVPQNPSSKIEIRNDKLSAPHKQLYNNYLYIQYATA